MAVYGGPDIVTEGLVLHLDAANDKSYDPVVEDCSLVLNMEGSNGSTTFTDGSKYGHTVTANGNAQISTGNSRFGASSAYFDGNGDYLFISNNSVFNLESSDFTIEAHIFLTGYAQNNNGYYQSMIFGKDYNFGFSRSYTFQIGGTSNSWTSVNFTLFVTNTNISAYSASFNFELNRWYHIAVVRKGQSIRIYVDGIDIGGGTAVNPQTTSANINIGGYGADSGYNSYGYYYNHPGYIDSLRVVKGKALYTENFTPPKKSFPEYKWGDLSGNGNNGSFFNGVAYGSSNYGVMSFDGSNDYVDVTDVPFRFSNSFTVGIWIYWDGINQLSNICGKRNDTNPYNQYNLSIIDSPYTGGSSNKVTFFARRDNHTNSADDILLQYALPESGIYYIVGVASPSSQVLYVNTVSRASSSKNISSFTYNVPNKNFRIGDAYSTIFFNGNIYQCQLYNRGLSSDEITQNFEATKGRYGL